MAEAAKQLLDELAKDYDDVVKALGRMSKHIAEHGDEAMAETANTFVKSASDLADKIKLQSESLSKQAGEQVREHPVLAASLAAAAVGLIGYAISQSGKTKR